MMNSKEYICHDQMAVKRQCPVHFVESALGDSKCCAGCISLGYCSLATPYLLEVINVYNKYEVHSGKNPQDNLSKCN